jgi:hypothetical protein
LRARLGSKPRPWWIRPVGATVVLALALLGWQLYRMHLADVHVSQNVKQALKARGKADIVVVLPFTPEQFHAKFFTDCCSIGRVQGRRFYLVDVSKSEVDHIGEQYWVKRVELWKRTNSG